MRKPTQFALNVERGDSPDGLVLVIDTLSDTVVRKSNLHVLIYDGEQPRSEPTGGPLAKTVVAEKKTVKITVNKAALALAASPSHSQTGTGQPHLVLMGPKGVPIAKSRTAIDYDQLFDTAGPPRNTGTVAGAARENTNGRTLRRHASGSQPVTIDFEQAINSDVAKVKILNENTPIADIPGGRATIENVALSGARSRFTYEVTTEAGEVIVGKIDILRAPAVGAPAFIVFVGLLLAVALIWFAMPAPNVATVSVMPGGPPETRCLDDALWLDKSHGEVILPQPALPGLTTGVEKLTSPNGDCENRQLKAVAAKQVPAQSLDVTLNTGIAGIVLHSTPVRIVVGNPVILEARDHKGVCLTPGSSKVFDLSKWANLSAPGKVIKLDKPKPSGGTISVRQTKGYEVEVTIKSKASPQSHAMVEFRFSAGGNQGNWGKLVLDIEDVCPGTPSKRRALKANPDAFTVTKLNASFDLFGNDDGVGQSAKLVTTDIPPGLDLKSGGGGSVVIRALPAGTASTVRFKYRIQENNRTSNIAEVELNVAALMKGRGTGVPGTINVVVPSAGGIVLPFAKQKNVRASAKDPLPTLSIHKQPQYATASVEGQFVLIGARRKPAETSDRVFVKFITSHGTEALVTVKITFADTCKVADDELLYLPAGRYYMPLSSSLGVSGYKQLFNSPDFSWVRQSDASVYLASPTCVQTRELRVGQVRRRWFSKRKHWMRISSALRYVRDDKSRRRFGSVPKERPLYRLSWSDADLIAKGLSSAKKRAFSIPSALQWQAGLIVALQTGSRKVPFYDRLGKSYVEGVREWTSTGPTINSAKFLLGATTLEPDTRWKRLRPPGESAVGDARYGVRFAVAPL